MSVSELRVLSSRTAQAIQEQMPPEVDAVALLRDVDRILWDYRDFLDSLPDTREPKYARRHLNSLGGTADKLHNGLLELDDLEAGMLLNYFGGSSRDYLELVERLSDGLTTLMAAIQYGLETADFARRRELEGAHHTTLIVQMAIAYTEAGGELCAKEDSTFHMVVSHALNDIREQPREEPDLVSHREMIQRALLRIEGKKLP